MRTGAMLAELPLTNVSFEDELNEVGSMSATVDMFSTDLDAAFIKAATIPARTAIYIEFDNASLAWGGIVWKRRVRRHTLELVCSGFLSYFARTRVTSTLTFTNVDQFAIARGLLEHAMGKNGGDIDIDLGSDLSGIARTITYEAADRKPVLEALQELAELGDGFDLAISARYDDTLTPIRQLRLGYPQLGRPLLGTPLLIEYPGNITDWDWPEEGDRMITTAYVRGELAGTDSEPPVVEVNDLSLVSVGYPRLEEEYGAPAGADTTAELTAYGQERLAEFGRPVVLPTFTVAAGAHPLPPHSQDIGAGDWLRLRMTDAKWFPEGPAGEPGYDGHVRVVKRSVRLGGGDGGETLSLTVNPIEVT